VQVGLEAGLLEARRQVGEQHAAQADDVNGPDVER